MTDKIKILLIKKHKTVNELAELIGTTPQNIYNKFKRDNFSEKELSQIAEKLGVKYEGFFMLDNDERI